MKSGFKSDYDKLNFHIFVRTNVPDRFVPTEWSLLKLRNGRGLANWERAFKLSWRAATHWPWIDAARLSSIFTLKSKDVMGEIDCFQKGKRGLFKFWTNQSIVRQYLSRLESFLPFPFLSSKDPLAGSISEDSWTGLWGTWNFASVFYGYCFCTIVAESSLMDSIGTHSKRQMRQKTNGALKTVFTFSRLCTGIV